MQQARALRALRDAHGGVGDPIAIDIHTNQAIARRSAHGYGIGGPLDGGTHLLEDMCEFHVTLH